LILSGVPFFIKGLGTPINHGPDGGNNQYFFNGLYNQKQNEPYHDKTPDFAIAPLSCFICHGYAPFFDGWKRSL